MEMNKKLEMNDDQLDQVSGGDSGVSTNMHHLPMNDVEIKIESPELQDDQLDQVVGGTGGGVVYEYEIGEKVELSTGGCRAGNQHWMTPWGIITNRYEQNGQPWYTVKCCSCGYESDGYTPACLRKL